MAGRVQPAYREPDTTSTKRHRDAYAALLAHLGRHLAVPVLVMAIYDRPATEYGREVARYLDGPKASGAGLTALRLGLDTLADAMGLAE